MELKKAKVIRLKTEEESSILNNKYRFTPEHGNPLLFNEKMLQAIDRGYECQYLYITVGHEVDPPKAGDWCYSTRGIVGRFGEFENSYLNECRKIIATTDKALSSPISKKEYEYLSIKRNGIRDASKHFDHLAHHRAMKEIKSIDITLSIYEKRIPEPSKGFLEAYCKAGGIDEVLVEYEYTGGHEEIPVHMWHTLKVDRGNTITIRQEKKEYTHDDITHALAYGYGARREGLSHHQALINYKQANNLR